MQALREGASGMLVKPFTGQELLGEVRRALAASQMRYEALQYRYMSPVLDSIALTLSTAIEARNLETGEHCRQLGVLSERMAAVLGGDERQRMTIRIGGYLHDIGKIGIADAILLKPGRLTDEEMAEMRRHSEIGAAILEVHEAMADIAQIVRHHHERWDGMGYPDRLVGDAIPLGGRIIAVADAFSAMTSDRIYRRALPIERAWEELRAHTGTQFDPEIVAVFEQVVDEQGRIRALDASLEQHLTADVNAPMSQSDDWRSGQATAPALHPASVPVQARVDALAEVRAARREAMNVRSLTRAKAVRCSRPPKTPGAGKPRSPDRSLRHAFVQEGCQSVGPAICGARPAAISGDQPCRRLLVTIHIPSSTSSTGPTRRSTLMFM